MYKRNVIKSALVVFGMLCGSAFGSYVTSDGCYFDWSSANQSPLSALSTQAGAGCTVSLAEDNTVHLVDGSTTAGASIAAYPTGMAAGDQSYVIQYDFKFAADGTHQGYISADQRGTSEIDRVNLYFVPSVTTASVCNRAGVKYDSTSVINPDTWYTFVVQREDNKWLVTVFDRSTNLPVVQNHEITVVNDVDLSFFRISSVLVASSALCDTYIDNIKIGNAIPEPATIALLLTGFVGTFFAKRKQ